MKNLMKIAILYILGYFIITQYNIKVGNVSQEVGNYTVAIVALHIGSYLAAVKLCIMLIKK